MTGSNLAVQARAEKPERFAREKFFRSDWKSYTDEFLSLFHRYGYIYKPLSGGYWLSANEQWKLTDSEILKALACAHPHYIHGARSGKLSRFAVLDIDAKSKYHNQQALDQLRHVLCDAGIKETVVYRSSHSDGWHLYIFFDEPLLSTDLREQLVALLQLNGFKLAKGTLEVFPAPGDGSIGQGLRLPLQPGWAWLDQRTLDIDYFREEVSPTKALEWFLEQLTECSNSYTQFRILKSHVAELSSRKQSVCRRAEPTNVYPFKPREHKSTGDCVDEVKKIFSHMPPGINTNTWWRGRCYYDSGLTGPSQRAEAVFCLGHYLFYGDPSRSLEALGYGYEQDREWLIEEILSTKHNDHSNDINRGRSEVFAHVHRATHWIPPHRRDQENTPYKPQVPIAWTRNSANLKAGSRGRIRQALDDLIAEGNPFSIRDLIARAKCHHKTLNKHHDLWKQDYDQFHVRLASVACEYNAVVGVGSSETQPPATVLQKVTPPGLLAARRVIYELNMRDERAKRHVVKTKESERLDAGKEWRESITDRIPSDLTTAESKVLKVLVTFLTWRLAHSPSYEDQLWLAEILAAVRTELVSKNRSVPVSPAADLEHPT